MESNRVLVAEKRQEAGSGNARSLRKQGKLPAIIYGHSKTPISIIIDENKVNQYYRQPSFTAKVIEIQIGKSVHKVIPHQIQIHPTKDMLRHVDFLFLGNKRQTVQVPIIYKNKMLALGVKRGGFFNIVKRKILLDCPVDVIPPNIEIDVVKLRIGQSIKASMLALPANVKLALPDNLILASVSGRGKNDEETAEDPESKEAGSEK